MPLYTDRRNSKMVIVFSANEVGCEDAVSDNTVSIVLSPHRRDCTTSKICCSIGQG